MRGNLARWLSLAHADRFSTGDGGKQDEGWTAWSLPASDQTDDETAGLQKLVRLVALSGALAACSGGASREQDVGEAGNTQETTTGGSTQGSDSASATGSGGGSDSTTSQSSGVTTVGAGGTGEGSSNSTTQSTASSSGGSTSGGGASTTDAATTEGSTGGTGSMDTLAQQSFEALSSCEIEQPCGAVATGSGECPTPADLVATLCVMAALRDRRVGVYSSGSFSCTAVGAQRSTAYHLVRADGSVASAWMSSGSGIFEDENGASFGARTCTLNDASYFQGCIDTIESDPVALRACASALEWFTECVETTVACEE